MPIEYLPLTCDLNGFNSRIKRNLLAVGFLERFPLCFNPFVLLFRVTPCLVVAVQLCTVGAYIIEKLMSNTLLLGSCN